MGKLSMKMKENLTGILVFTTLLLFLLFNYNPHIDEDILCSYVIDYKTGFGGRKFIASCISTLLSSPSMAQIRYIAYALSLLICALFSWLCNHLVKNMTDRQGTGGQISSLYLITLYLLCPASIMFLLKYPNLGRLDIFLYFICLLFCIVFYRRDKNRIFYYLSTCLLLILAILIHHVFVATYLSFLAALFIYDIWSEGFKVKRFLSYGLLAIITTCMFITVITCSSMNMTLDEAVHYNPNFDLSRKFVCFEYYAHISDHIEQYVIPKLARLRAGFCLTVIFMSPLIFAIIKLWRDVYKSLSQPSLRKLLIGMHCGFLLFIPAFCITVDYPRWFGAFFFLQFLIIGYFLFDSKSKFGNISLILQENLKKYVIIAAVLLVYCSMLEYFYSDTYFQGVEMIIEKLNIHRVTTLLPPQYRL